MSLRRLSVAERRDWVRLVRTPNIGPLTFARLIERFGNATDALVALPEIASRVAKVRRIELARSPPSTTRSPPRSAAADGASPAASRISPNSSFPSIRRRRCSPC